MWNSTGHQNHANSWQSPSPRPTMKLVLLLGLVAICSAQMPMPCESPKRWEGRRLLFDQSKMFREFSRFVYDEINMRTRVVEEVEQGQEKNFYDTLTLHMERKEYRVDLRTRKCNVTTTMRPFRPIGVPPESKFLFEAEVGPSQISNEHFTTATFGGNFTEDHVQYVTTVTLPDCVPVGDNYYNDVTGLVESRYYDVKLGIADPDAFLPPSECTM